MDEQKRKQLEKEFRKDKFKRFLIVFLGVFGFIGAAVFILYGKLG